MHLLEKNLFPHVPFFNQPRLRHSALAVIFKPDSFSQAKQKDYSVLVIQRAINDWDVSSGCLAFPGGKNEGNQDDLSTVYRQTMQEVGINLKESARLLGTLGKSFSYKDNLRVTVFLFQMLKEPLVCYNPQEVKNYKWVQLKTMLDASLVVHQDFKLRIPLLGRIVRCQIAALELLMERRLFGFSLLIWGDIARKMGVQMGVQYFKANVSWLLLPIKHLGQIIATQWYLRKRTRQFKQNAVHEGLGAKLLASSAWVIVPLLWLALKA